MIKKVALFAVAVCLALSGAVRPASAFSEAGESYAYPTFTELTQATVMMGGVDLSADELITDYIRLMFCDIYKENYNDEFSWHEVKKQIRERAKSKRDYYRHLYQVDGVVSFGQYDFTKKEFPLVERSVFNNVGYMSLLSGDMYSPFCQFTDPKTRQNVGGGSTYFSKSVNIVLSEPFTFTSLKITEQQAQDLLSKLERFSDNNERQAYIRFRFRVQSIVSSKFNSKTNNHFQTDLGGEIMSVDLFYDKEMTKWLMRVPLRHDIVR